MDFDDFLTLGVREHALVVEVIHQIRLEVEYRLLLLFNTCHLQQQTLNFDFTPFRVNYVITFMVL